MAKSESNTVTTAGLKWVKRKGGKVPYWVADEGCVKAGYPVKTANLSEFADNEAALIFRCQTLEAQQASWKNDNVATAIGVVPVFDGTWGSLFDIYERDPKSKFNTKLKPRSVKTYTKTLIRLKGHIGRVRIDESDGRDLMDWFAVWAVKEDPNDPKSPYLKLSMGLLGLAVLKAALSFGVFCRYTGCAEFYAVVEHAEFPTLKPRDKAPTRQQIEAAGMAAIRANMPSRAFAYALQFETTARQTDIIGEWVELSDPRPSPVLGYGMKWIGPTWAHIDESNVWRLTHGKTDQTSAAKSAYDLSLCPMVMDHLKYVPPEYRRGPLIIDERTGLPYLYNAFKYGWNKDYAAAGLPKGLWNRDTRAGGNTEAQIKGARLEDRKKVMGHTKESETTAQVYDRDVLEAHRRVAKARTGE